MGLTTFNVVVIVVIVVIVVVAAIVPVNTSTMLNIGVQIERNTGS